MTLTAPTATSDAPVAAPAHRSVPPRVRAALAVTAAAVAFAPSLSGLVADLRYGAPTGDLLAVPVVAAVMLDATVRSGRRVWCGRLGHGDLVVAGGLVAAAFVLLLLPVGTAPNGRWLTRLDLLAHPLVLAAFAVLLLGMRVLAVAVVPLAYGLLVWPWPVTWLNVHAVAPLARATYETAGHAAQWLGAARMVDVGAENTLRIGTGERAFEVVVAPACSGITGIAAYLVVAGAVLALSHGRLRARLGWLGCGVAAVWLANVVRVTSLAVTGDRWGAPVALDLLHPVAGLALDAVVVVVLVASLHRFGLRWTPFVSEPAPSPQTTAAALAPPSARSLAVRGGLVAALAATFLATTLHVAGPGRHRARRGAATHPHARRPVRRRRRRRVPRPRGVVEGLLRPQLGVEPVPGHHLGGGRERLGGRPRRHGRRRAARPRRAVLLQLPRRAGRPRRRRSGSTAGSPRPASSSGRPTASSGRRSGGSGPSSPTPGCATSA